MAFRKNRFAGDSQESRGHRLIRRLGDRRAWLALAAVGLCAAADKPRNLEQALDAQRALVDQHPNDPRLLNDLGNLLVLAGSLQEAEQTYRRALERSPTDVTTRYNLALVLQERGHDRKAARQLEELIELEPHHAWAHYQLGTLYAAAGRRARALRHYERAFSLDRSLTSPAVNPHIVENRLVTEALLRSYVSESPSSQAPRLYRQPASVTDLLLPPEPGPRAEPAPPTGAVTGAPRSESEPAAREAPPAETGQTVPRAPSSEAGPTPPADRLRVTPFVPDLPSTGRLELRLVPTSETVASAPIAP